MNLTKAQRDELNNLSLQLFGVSSKWQSLLSRPEFRVVTETIETQDAPKFVSLSNSKKNRSGTVITLAKAIAKGVFKGEKGEELLKKINETPVRKVQSREPTFEELRQSMIDNLDLQKLGRLSLDELATVVAYRLVNNSLGFSVQLEVREADQAGYDEILGTLSDELKAKVATLTPPPEARNPNSVTLDGLTVMKELAIVVGHPDKAFTDYVNLLAGPTAPKKQAELIKGLTVNQFINKMNRSKNKLARDKQARPEYYARKEARAKAKAEALKAEQVEAAAKRAEADQAAGTNPA